MPNLLDIEEQEISRPVLCIFGSQPPVTRKLLDEYSDKFRIILVQNTKPSYLDVYPSTYFLSYQNASLLPKLQEEIRYAFVFLTDDSKEYVSKFLDKAMSSKTHTLFIFTAESLQANFELINRLQDLPNARFAVAGEILQKRSKVATPLSKIIENVILNREIKLIGNETFPVYPVGLSDFVNEISRLLFGTFKSNTFYYVFYKHPETLLEVAHLIGRVEPEIKIHFSDTSHQQTFINRASLNHLVENQLQMEYAFVETPSNSFENEMQKLFQEKDDPEELLTRLKNKKRTRKKGRVYGGFKLFLISLFFGIFLFLFTNLLFLGLGLYFLKGSVENLSVGNFSGAESTARLSNAFLTFVKPTVYLTFDTISLFDQKGSLLNLYMVIEKGSVLASLAGTTGQTLLTSGAKSEKTLTGAIANASYLYQESQKIVLATGDKRLSTELKDTYSKLLSFSEVIPTILGFGETKNYLLLFQNSDELRPTGGFIGSIGDLSVKNGEASSIVVQDVYELDGQLRNHIEPPFIVRRYLQPHLYLRDSNFYLNFQEAASKSAAIYFLETNKKPDAVIAINLQVLKSILDVTGPVKLITYNTTVTSDNVSEFLHGTIKDGFFPGSTGKRDVLNALFTELLKKSANNPEFNIKIAKIIPDLLEQKDIQVSFSDNNIQKLFSANLYAGELNDTRIKNQKLIPDYLAVNEANIGVNKVNRYVSREIEYKALLGISKLSSKVTLYLTNASPNDDYKVYLTFAVPQNSHITSVSINDVKQNIVKAVTDFAVYEKPNFKIPEGLEVEEFTKENRTYFAFIAKAKKGYRTPIEITYENGAGKQLSTIATYSLLTSKQSGTSPYELKVSVNYPEGYSPVDTSADSYGKNFLEQNQIIKTDSKIEIELQKQ